MHAFAFICLVKVLTPSLDSICFLCYFVQIKRAIHPFDACIVVGLLIGYILLCVRQINPFTHHHTFIALVLFVPIMLSYIRCFALLILRILFGFICFSSNGSCIGPPIGPPLFSYYYSVSTCFDSLSFFESYWPEPIAPIVLCFLNEMRNGKNEKIQSMSNLVAKKEELLSAIIITIHQSDSHHILSCNN